MIGSRQMERIIGEAEKRDVKVAVVSDPEQLQAIKAGAAFRSIAEWHGSVETPTSAASMTTGSATPRGIWRPGELARRCARITSNAMSMQPTLTAITNSHRSKS